MPPHHGLVGFRSASNRCRRPLGGSPWASYGPARVGGSMTGRKRSEAEQELEGLAEDWIALWQSEIAGLMADPELAEAWGSLLGLGAAWLRAVMPGQPFAPPRAPAHEPYAGTPWAAPRPPPAAAAPAAGGQPRRDGPGEPADAHAARLAERLAELERRLAELERRPAGGGA